MPANTTHDQMTEAVDAEFSACYRELKAALGLTGRVTWDELIAKVRDLAVTEHEAGYREAPLDLDALRLSGADNADDGAEKGAGK